MSRIITCGKTNDVSVLFFGRSNCDSSEKILSHLIKCGFYVTYVKSKSRGERLPEDIFWWKGDFILSFRSLFFLPKEILDRAKIAAINFHPAPPEYPGSGCINFALYDRCKKYGVTAHLMNEKIDNGAILEVRRFPVHESENLQSLLERTHGELLYLAFDFITSLDKHGESFINEKINDSKGVNWKGKAKLMKEIDALQSIDLNVTKVELDRIVRATHIDGYPLKIKLHGYDFSLEKNINLL
ncbi:MAG: methionyl-tRNA formyltransferase [Psychroserpens sp.]|jgi:methionyl-tRNA formyltransferase